MIITLLWSSKNDIRTVWFKQQGDKLTKITGSKPGKQAFQMSRADRETPVVVVEAGSFESSFYLKELWEVLRPDQPWKYGKQTREETWTQVLGELFWETCSMSITTLQEVIYMLSDQDPLKAFFLGASQDMVLEQPISLKKTVSQVKNGKRSVKFDSDDIHDFFQEGGVLSQNLAGYCYREQQASMVKEVCQAFQKNQFLLAEAGTGVGKSVAYLVPSLFWAAATGNKVVVSTRTRALQRQLAEKDLPLLEKVIPFEFDWQVAYGRENYLCRLRFNNLKRNNRELSEAEKRLSAGLIFWLARSGSGRLQDLNWNHQGVILWKKVCCQRFGCNPQTCPWSGECFFNMARNRLGKCDLIVVNHALLLSDVSLDGKVLPEYRYLVVDEAHNLERVAFDHLGVRFVVPEGLRLLSRLIERKNRIDRGYLAALQGRFLHLKSQIHEISSLVESAHQAVEALSYLLPGSNSAEYGVRRIRAGARGAVQLSNACHQASMSLNDIQRALSNLAEDVTEWPEEEKNVLEMAGEVGEKAAHLHVIAEALVEEGEQVVWLEREEKAIKTLAVGPLHAGEKLYELLYQKMSTVVMASATLTVGESFDFMRERLGLHHIEKGRLREWQVTSPYDYEENCRVLVVQDVGEPGSKRYTESINQCINVISRSINKRTLVLFTSRSLLLQIADELSIKQDKGRVISQYRDGEFGTLLSKMENRRDGILLGTETFWEGVDLPGEMLNCLVVTRLPFRPPGEPLTEALNEYLNRNGRNGFMEYSLPEAVIRFRQGLGRLIRSETDSGIMVILDPRFCMPPLGRRYSELFRTSIPMQNLAEIKSQELEQELAEWFRKQEN